MLARARSRARSCAWSSGRAVRVAASASALLLLPRDAHADDTQEAPRVTEAPPKTAELKAPSPDARRYLPPTTTSTWIGGERALAGELSLIQPRPYETTETRLALAPALAEKRVTSAFMRGGFSAVRGSGPDWKTLELGSLHDLQGGAVLGTHLRQIERARTYLQGLASLALPLRSLWVVPIVGVGARAEDAPFVLASVEVRTDRTRRAGLTGGAEGTSWTRGRTRFQGFVGGVWRVTRRVSVEERIGVGRWSGPDLDGDVAFHTTTTFVQAISRRLALLERTTISRAPLVQASDRAPSRSAWGTDASVGARFAITDLYGLMLEGSEGGQHGANSRLGAELTLYGTLF